MKYFVLCLFILFFLGAGKFCLNAFLNLKIAQFYKLSFKALNKKNKISDIYISTFYLKQVIAILLKNRAKKELNFLICGRISLAKKWLIKHNFEFLSLALTASNNINQAIEEFEKFVRRENVDIKPALLLLGCLYLQKNNKQKAKLCFDNLTEKQKNKYLKAQFYFLKAFFDADEGDLYSASLSINFAVKLFHKQMAFFEEANAYLFMGIIYKTALIYDIAQMMFSTALDIFKKICATKYMAYTYGNLGILMCLQKRFDEALDYFEKALNIAKDYPIIRAEILNQKALLHLITEEYGKATELANQALQIHQKMDNPLGIAFCKENMAQIYFAQKDFKKAVSLSEEACPLYWNLQNYSAYFENMHLCALALFMSDNFDVSEEKLRKILDMQYKCFSNFHFANVYNLLGLIYLKKNDHRRALGLFQQSLDLEQKNNRLSGIATDYMNMSLVEWKRGDILQAQKTLQTALEYAKANQDEELSDIILKQINFITSSN